MVPLLVLLLLWPLLPLLLLRLRLLRLRLVVYQACAARLSTVQCRRARKR